LTVLPSSDNPATLVHRYSFQDAPGSPTFADSVGGPDWAGTPEGTATLTGSGLVLDGSDGCYGLLPPYITSDYTQMTVEFWADIGDQTAVWTRVFSFGNQTGGGQKQSGVDYSPNAAGGYQNLDLLNNSSVDAYVNNNVALTNVTGAHVTVVVDSLHGAMCYYYGTNVLTTLASAIPSLADIDDVYDLIGASLVAVDPYLVGTIHEFRVYQGVLSPQAVALNDAMGPANYIELSAPTLSASISGGNIILTWPKSVFNFSVQSKPAVTSGSWSTLTNIPVSVGTNWQVSLPSTGAAKFFQLLNH
jgi:Concanavalin A-like lectin/glucanases superfamily